MKINEIKYEKTFNLGNHSSETIGVSLSPSENETAETLFITAKKMVHGDFSSVATIGGEKFGEPVVKKETIDLVNELVLGEAPAAPAKPKVTKAAARPKAAKSLEAEKEETTQEEVSDTQVEEAPAAAKPGKRVINKNTPYDRNKQAHKDLFIKELSTLNPEWKKAPEKAKEISVNLEGVDFLDSEGMVLEEFTAKMKAML